MLVRVKRNLKGHGPLRSQGPVASWEMMLIWKGIFGESGLHLGAEGACIDKGMVQWFREPCMARLRRQVLYNG